MVVSSSSNGHVLPFQVIFQGLTICSLPPLTDGRHECVECRWDLTFSSNLWSIMDTMKNFLGDYSIKLKKASNEALKFIIKPRDDLVHRLLELSHQQGILGVNTYYPSSNCTSIYQPVDIILQ